MPLYVVLGLLLSACGLVLAACTPPSADDGTTPAPSRNATTEVALPDPASKGATSVEEALRTRRSIRSFSAEPLDLEDVAQLLWAAQGLSDETRGLRTAPSAGAVYPLETYLVAGEVNGLATGVYRYHPETHTLSPAAASDVRDDLARAALDQRFIAQAPATVVIACVYARTEQRYGQRAERYVHMEAGHAAQNLALQATALGLGTVPVGAFADDRVAEVLGLAPDEAPLYLLPVGRP